MTGAPLEYDFETLAREIVASRLAELRKAPEAAGEIAKKIVVAAVLSTKVRQEPRVTVRAVCRGIMSGVWVIGKDLPATAARLVRELGSVAETMSLDPSDVLTWAMEGIADVVAPAGVDIRADIQNELEDSVQGTGEAFSQICSRVAAPKEG